MAPEVDAQNSADENYFEVIGSDDGRTAESMDQFIQGLESGFEYPALATLNLEPDPVIEDGEEDPEDEEDPDPDEETPSVPPATPTDTVTINGQEVPLADVQRLYEFDQHLRQNPDIAQRVQAAVQPVVPPTDPPTPQADKELTPPEFLDLEDPAQKFMWDTYVAQQKQLDTVTTATAEQIRSGQEREANARAISDMDQALTAWKTAHPNFNEDQIIEVRKHAAQMNLIDSLIATSPNGVTALVRAMDLAALDDPTLRTVYLDPDTHKTQTRQQRSATRKSKLNSLGGSSGSAPRTTSTPRPTTDKEARDQFAKGLEDSFNQ